MDYKEQLITSIIEEVSSSTYCLYFLLNLLVAYQLAMLLTASVSLPFYSCDIFFTFLPLAEKLTKEKNPLLER